jgi:transposase InsO family protein
LHLPTSSQLHTSVIAAVILLARTFTPWVDWPPAEQILERVGAGRSQAYAMKARLEEVLTALASQAGRPASAPPTDSRLLEVCRSVQEYLMSNPGAAHLCNGRHEYTDTFRQFIVGLLSDELTVSDVAKATHIPLGTLKEWSQRRLQSPGPRPEMTLRKVHHHQIINLYLAWKGTFVAFCKMVREQHRLNYGMTAISTLLHEVGLRHRKKHRKQAPWSSDTYRKLFPGAQWLGDGSTIKIHGINVESGKQTFRFNLEAILDVASNAVVSMAVTESEDEAAVLAAFQDAVSTAGQAPEALSLDNRPSNHTESVVEALKQENTTLLATTLGRGQSKAPLEGTFGLFNQDLPELRMTGDTPRERARSFLEVAFSSWARGRNGRPRKQLGGKSPAEYYKEQQPTEEEKAEARRWIAELQRRQQQMRRTREQRADPEKLAFLKEALLALGIPDSSNHQAVNLAYYSREAILTGVSTFQAMLQAGTVPDGADPARYLGGIIRNLHEELELNLTTELQIQNRGRFRDICLRNLLRRNEEILRQDHPPERLLSTLVDQALSAPCALDFHFWSARCAEVLGATPGQIELYRSATRRIAAGYRADRDRKRALHNRLSAALT